MSEKNQDHDAAAAPLEPAPLDPAIQRLFASEQAASAPAAHSRERVWGRVSATVGLPPVPAPVTRAPWMKLVGGGVILLAGIAALWALRPAASAPPTATATPAPAPIIAPTSAGHSAAVAVAAAEPAVTKVPAAAEPAVTNVPAAANDRVVATSGARAGVDSPPASPRALPVTVADQRRPAASSPRAAVVVAATVTDEASEYATLEAARQALAEGDWRRALVHVRSHEQRFPRGQLVEERESLVIRALAAAHEPAAARARADRFVRRFPSSIFLPVIRSALR